MNYYFSIIYGGVASRSSAAVCAPLFCARQNSPLCLFQTEVVCNKIEGGCGNRAAFFLCGYGSGVQMPGLAREVSSTQCAAVLVVCFAWVCARAEVSVFLAQTKKCTSRSALAQLRPDMAVCALCGPCSKEIARRCLARPG